MGRGRIKGNKKQYPLKEPQIFTYRFLLDKDRQPYLPYCKYRWHPGFIRTSPQTCIERDCKHFKPIYLKDLPQPDEDDGVGCMVQQEFEKAYQQPGE
jgi:hypothetical protein